MKSPMVDIVFDDLLRKIINLSIVPGQKISENKICEEYDVSRTIVRSVFLKLQQLGFLHIQPQSGSFATKIDFIYIKSALILRLATEKELLKRIMSSDKEREEVVAKLKENYKQQEIYKDGKENRQKFEDLDVEFHNIIMNSHDGDNMSKLIENHLMHIRRWRNLTIMMGLSEKVLIDGHLKIINAIEKQDKEKLIELMDKHIAKHIDKDISKEYIWDDIYMDYFK